MRALSTPARARHVLTALLCALLLPLCGGCVYRMNIQQGNFLEKRAVDQLQVGMTRSQVRYLLGTPMVPSTFDTDRWDYLYYLKKGRIHRPIEYRLTVFFENEKVARIDNHGKDIIDSEPTVTERPLRPIG